MLGEAEHTLQPYGSQPIIENLQVQGQEARLILPSAEQPAGTDGQAALIVRYPQPIINIAGHECQFFVLWADRDHIRTIAQTLRFSADSASTGVATLAPPIVWEHLPPGLVYTAYDGLWLINSDEQPVQVHNNSQVALSPDGTQLLSYDAPQRDVWLLNPAEGAIWRLTNTPDRVETNFAWWPARPDTVLFSLRPREICQRLG